MHITIIAGARPNFMKISPIIREILIKNEEGFDVKYSLVHTGQHYDEKMSETFFKELSIPKPHANLASGSGTQAEQTATIMLAFEKYLTSNPTDLVMVVGDVTSTLACAIVAKKANVKLAHVEGGIRSYDSTMPEEINRKVTDSISDYFFTTTKWASENLIKEGVSSDSVFLVGNVMIDTLKHNLINIRKPSFFDEAKLVAGSYFVLTLHRPSNVDDSGNLSFMLDEIVRNARGLPIVFPVHPRTRERLKNLMSYYKSVVFVEPMGYLEFIYLVKNSFAVVTDSGGITEETTVLGVPCMTIRANTERPETCTIGTNELIGTDPKKLEPYMDKLFSGSWKKGGIPEFWDGSAAKRIVSKLIELYKA